MYTLWKALSNEGKRMLIVFGVIGLMIIIVISVTIGYNLGKNQGKQKRKESVDYFWEGRRHGCLL